MIIYASNIPRQAAVSVVWIHGWLTEVILWNSVIFMLKNLVILLNLFWPLFSCTASLIIPINDSVDIHVY